MLDYLRRLATTGFAYTGASVISKLVAVALLPVYTALVTPFEYGQAEVLFAAVVAFSIFVRFGLLEALLRFYYLPDERGPDVVRTGFAALFWTVTVFALVLLPFAGAIAGPDNEPQRWHMMRTRHVWGPLRHLQSGWRRLRGG